MKNQTRREFLKNGAKMAGIVTLLFAWGKRILFGQEPEEKPPKYPQFSCGEESEEAPRILVAYASESGSTVDIAKAIGDTLCAKGLNVETKWIKTTNDIGEYDAVIIGSPIIYEKWMPEVRSFVKSNKEILKNIPVAYFMTCLALSSKREDAMQQAIEYSDKLVNRAPEIKPISVGRFGGVLDYSKISFVNRILLKAVMKKYKVPEGDYRDWEAIRSWADNIDFQLDLPQRFADDLSAQHLLQQS